MSGHGLNKLVEQARHEALRHHDGGLTDGQLLDAFLSRRDEAAFEALVWRHSPMVLGVCRRVVGNVHDAEDAFQATFLVLVRKASSLKQQALVGNWLYGVAYRTALKARTLNARQHAKEQPLPDLGLALTEEPGPDADELRRLDREVQRLPAKYREPLILCELQQRSRQEVARHLGLPEGTLSSRLATARKLLARRLGQPSAAAGAVSLAVLTSAASASVPTPLVVSTVIAATARAAGTTTVGAAAAAVVLHEKVLHAMWMSHCKKVGAVSALVLWACLFLGSLMVPLMGAQAPPQGPRDPLRPPAGSAGRYGSIHDPAGDGSFMFSGDQVHINVPAGDHALAIEGNRMNAPRILQEVNGDFILQTRVLCGMREAAASVVEGRRPFYGAGLVLFADAKNYIRLERAELVSADRNLRYGSFELRRNGVLERIGESNEMPLETDEPVYLRLERRGNWVYGSISADGTQWRSFPPIEMKLPSKVQVGMLAGHNTSKGFEAVFLNFKLFADVDKPQPKWQREAQDGVRPTATSTSPRPSVGR